MIDRQSELSIQNSEADNEAFGELVRGFEQWKEENPQIVQQTNEEIARHEKISFSTKDRVVEYEMPENGSEALLWFIYGMRLSQKINLTSQSVGIPQAKFDQDINGEAKHSRDVRSGNTHISMRVDLQMFQIAETEKLNEAIQGYNINLLEVRDGYISSLIEIAKNGSLRAILKLAQEKLKSSIELKQGELVITPEIASALISSGAHEFAHEVFIRSAGDQVRTNSIIQGNAHKKRFEQVRLNSSRKNVLFFELSKNEEAQSIYDSSLVEFMAINWELMVLKKFCSWAEEEINSLEERREDAIKVREKISWRKGQRGM